MRFSFPGPRSSRTRAAAIVTVVIAVVVPAARATAPAPPAAAAATHDVSAAIEAAAREHRIPSVLLKGLAWAQSRWRQRDDAATPPAGAPGEPDGRVGLMGIPGAGRADVDRLRDDWRYNVEQGARALSLAWNRAPIIGNGRLEDWPQHPGVLVLRPGPLRHGPAG
jgi:hypothetical protein